MRKTWRKEWKISRTVAVVFKSINRMRRRRKRKRRREMRKSRTENDANDHK